jgi:hypothetical protein
MKDKKNSPACENLRYSRLLGLKGLCHEISIFLMLALFTWYFLTCAKGFDNFWFFADEKNKLIVLACFFEITYQF